MSQHLIRQIPAEYLGRRVRITLETGTVYEGTYFGTRFDAFRLDGADAVSIRGEHRVACPRGIVHPYNKAFFGVVSVEPFPTDDGEGLP